MSGTLTVTSSAHEVKPAGTISAFAGKPAPKEHFTEAHLLAITQAICDDRRSHGVDGPLDIGKDTHALSGPVQRSAIEVLAGDNVEIVIQKDDGVTPTPVISRSILVYNRNRKDHLADGIVVTPSHHPPRDGGIRYNPPNGGPADTDVTQWIEVRASDLLRTASGGINRVPFAPAIRAATTHQEDFVLPYVKDRRESLYKVYAESFRDQSHLEALVNEAQEIVNNALR